MFGNTRRSGVVTSTSPWTSHQSLTVWTRWKSHLQIQKQNWKDQERGWLPLWVSRPKQGRKKYKKSKYAIGNVSKKDISKIIKRFEKIEKLPYEKKRPNHEPTERYLHLSQQLTKCMMRSNNLIWYNHGGYTEITAPYLNINVINKSESKRSIVNENLLQNCSAKENELCFTKEDES